MNHNILAQFVQCDYVGKQYIKQLIFFKTDYFMLKVHKILKRFSFKNDHVMSKMEISLA